MLQDHGGASLLRITRGKVRQMASNKHYEIDLNLLEAVETDPPSFEDLLRVADRPNSPNPFGNQLKRGKFVNVDGKRWLFDRQLAEFNYQNDGYDNEVSQFKLTLSFDTSLELQEIDSNRFLYSVSRHIAQSGWRDGKRGVGTFFQLGELEEGSIRGNIFAGIAAVGTFVATYPELKQGFQEILTDANFLSEQISTALRAAKLPDRIEDQDQFRQHYELHEERRPQRPAPDRVRLLRDE